MRTFTLSLILLCVSAVSAIAQTGPPADAADNERFQMLAVGKRAMLLDRESGKTWLLAAKGDKAAWIPIQKLEESSVASNWLKANLARSRNAEKVSMTEATRQVKLEEITDSEVAAEPFTVLVARERAELSRLKKEYGDRHPEVVASRTRLIELLKVGGKKEDE